MLTVGSLFSGIGGIDLGLERAGMKVLWQVEIDPWCRAVLARQWPEVERFEDVRSVGAGNLSRVDLIAGGFPCQDISQAGKGAGIKEGTRSGLWFEFARIIRELRPQYVLVENVPLLRKRGLGIVLSDLAACGYDAEWDGLPAAAVGAPHRRDRLWLVAHRQLPSFGPDAYDYRWIYSEPEKLTANERAYALRYVAPVGSDVADANRWRLAKLAQRHGESFLGFQGSFRDNVERYGLQERWLTEPSVGRVAHGVPNRVDRLRGLGNAVVPQVVEWIGRRIVEAEAEISSV